MPTDEWERGYSAGYSAALRAAREDIGGRFGETVPERLESIRKSRKSPKPKRKASAYSKRYGAAFRKVDSRFKKKNGSWKTNGFKNAQKAAHKLARRK